MQHKYCQASSLGAALACREGLAHTASLLGVGVHSSGRCLSNACKLSDGSNPAELLTREDEPEDDQNNYAANNGDRDCDLEVLSIPRLQSIKRTSGFAASSLA